MKHGATGRYIPGESFLHKLSPGIKLFGFVVFVVAVIIFNSPAALITESVLTIGLTLLTGLGIRNVLGPARMFISLTVIVFLITALLCPSDDPAWSLGVIHLSKEGALLGVVVALKIMMIVVMNSILNMTTKPVRFMSTFQTLMNPLKYVGLPSKKIAVVVFAFFHFIPTLGCECEIVRDAQIAAGARFESKKITERFMAGMHMLIPAVRLMYRRDLKLSDAMQARGYVSGSRRKK